ncbi:unnamed protein product [Durusdinium trenchii]|uniref:Uncharacterized protein n=1 Tax=Durusdinium trenchii TaxID=1381693 RepID=A0ABP0MT77_9DINO
MADGTLKAFYGMQGCSADQVLYRMRQRAHMWPKDRNLDLGVGTLNLRRLGRSHNNWPYPELDSRIKAARCRVPFAFVAWLMVRLSSYPLPPEQALNAKVRAICCWALDDDDPFDQTQLTFEPEDPNYGPPNNVSIDLCYTDAGKVNDKETWISTGSSSLSVYFGRLSVRRMDAMALAESQQFNRRKQQDYTAFAEVMPAVANIPLSSSYSYTSEEEVEVEVEEPAPEKEPEEIGSGASSPPLPASGKEITWEQAMTAANQEELDKVAGGAAVGRSFCIIEFPVRPGLSATTLRAPAGDWAADAVVPA